MWIDIQFSYMYFYHDIISVSVHSEQFKLQMLYYTLPHPHECATFFFIAVYNTNIIFFSLRYTLVLFRLCFSYTSRWWQILWNGNFMLSHIRSHLLEWKRFNEKKIVLYIQVYYKNWNEKTNQDHQIWCEMSIMCVCVLYK